MAEEVNPLERLQVWCKGDATAARFLSDLIEASQIADDLVDLDKPIDRAESMARLLHLSLVTIPANPFFDRYKGWLAPLISAAVLGWTAATRWEKETDETHLAFAFVYRDLVELVIVQTAHLIGGSTHAMTVQKDVMEYVRFMHHDGQTFGQWKTEVTGS